MSDEYSYGYRYFYWKYYEYDNSVIDPVSCTYCPANHGYTLKDWYVYNKYETFKIELTSNKLCFIEMTQWNLLYKKAKDYSQTEFVSTIYCARDATAKYYEMKYKDNIGLHHLIAILIYCNYDTLQTVFSKTYRLQNTNHSLKKLKKRHENYFHLGRALRECVECFGMKWTYDHSDINLYHGLSKRFVFSSLNANISGPFSTTSEFGVAVNFSNNQGMILNVNVFTGTWRYQWIVSPSLETDSLETLCCFDCSWISDYPNEKEIFFLGGLNKFEFITIIEVPTGKNYWRYITGLRQMTYFMTTGGIDCEWFMATSSFEEQMVFRLLAHAIYQCDPNHRYAYEFIKCPLYIKYLLRQHCQNIKYAWFSKEAVSPLHDFIFKFDNDFINIELITKVFPNIEKISLDGTNELKILLTEPEVYETILQYLKHNNETKLKLIEIDQIDFDEAVYMIKYYRTNYQKTFLIYSWNIVYKSDGEQLSKLCIEKCINVVPTLTWCNALNDQAVILLFVLVILSCVCMMLVFECTHNVCGILMWYLDRIIRYASMFGWLSFLWLYAYELDLDRWLENADEYEDDESDDEEESTQDDARFGNEQMKDLEEYSEEDEKYDVDVLNDNSVFLNVLQEDEEKKHLQYWTNLYVD
eukprot:379292_1